MYWTSILQKIDPHVYERLNFATRITGADFFLKKKYYNCELFGELGVFSFLKLFLCAFICSFLAGRSYKF
jgi:hypothetical protein